jgi:hypothetical protein
MRLGITYYFLSNEFFIRLYAARPEKCPTPLSSPLSGGRGGLSGGQDTTMKNSLTGEIKICTLLLYN